MPGSRVPQQPESPNSDGDGSQPGTSPSSSVDGTPATSTPSEAPSTSSSPAPRAPHRHAAQRNAQRGPLGWLVKLLQQPQAQLPMRIGFNVLVLFALMRLWPSGGRGMDGADEAIIKMPYSDFVRWERRRMGDDVKAGEQGGNNSQTGES